MATTKRIINVGGGSASQNRSGEAPQRTFTPTPEAKGRASKLRLFAVVLWVLAIAAEVAAIYVLVTCAKPIATTSWMWMGGLALVDLILVIAGSSLWKKANRLDPASRSNPTKFFIQNQLGVIVSVIAFLPFIIVVLTDKNLTGKEKGIIGGVAGVLMVIAGLASADFNPPSEEQYTEQSSRVEQLMGVNDVYWTKYGNRYHLYDDCQYLRGNRTDEIFEGTVAKARELKNITELCSVCEHRAEKALPAGGVGGSDHNHDHDHDHGE